MAQPEGEGDAWGAADVGGGAERILNQDEIDSLLGFDAEGVQFVLGRQGVGHAYCTSISSISTASTLPGAAIRLTRRRISARS